MTLPVVIYVFGYVSTVGVITNIFISMPASFCLSLAVVSLILSPFLPFAASVIMDICDIVARYMNFVINYAAFVVFDEAL